MASGRRAIARQTHQGRGRDTRKPATDDDDVVHAETNLTGGGLQGVTLRMRLFELSAMYRLPSGPTATSERDRAVPRPGPPSPQSPGRSVPRCRPNAPLPVDPAHAVGCALDDVDVACGVRGHRGRRAEVDRAREPAVTGEADSTGARQSRDDAPRVDLGRHGCSGGRRCRGCPPCRRQCRLGGQAGLRRRAPVPREAGLSVTRDDGEAAVVLHADDPVGGWAREMSLASGS